MKQAKGGVISGLFGLWDSWGSRQVSAGQGKCSQGLGLGSQAWEEFDEAMENDFRTASKRHWTTMRQWGKQHTVNTVCSEDGVLRTLTQDIVDWWKENFEDLNLTNTPSSEKAGPGHSGTSSLISEAEFAKVVKKLFSSTPLVGSLRVHGSLPNHSTCVDLEKAFKRGLLRHSGVSGPLIQAAQSLYDWCQRLVRMAGNKSNLFPVRVGFCHGCPLSPILFIFCQKADRISRHSQAVKGVWCHLLFADNVFLLASSVCDLQLSLDQFAAEHEATSIRISFSKPEALVLSRKEVGCFLWVGEEILPQVEEFKYLRVLFTREKWSGRSTGRLVRRLQ